MSNFELILVIFGLIILLGFVVLIVKHSAKDKESHVRVGKEWMTIAEYEKRFNKKHES